MKQETIHSTEATANRPERATDATTHSVYARPDIFDLGPATHLTHGGIKDKKKDSWNELGFYV